MKGLILSLIGSAFMIALSGAQAAPQGTDQGEWRYWGGDERSSRYSPLAEINRDNFGDQKNCNNFLKICDQDCLAHCMYM